VSFVAGTNDLDLEVKGLLQRVTEDQQQRCATARTAAAEQARKIVAAAYAQARRSVHDSTVRERARIEQGLRQAKGSAEIEARREEQKESRFLLGQMGTRLAEALNGRRQEPKQRRDWIIAAMSRAAALVAGRAWILEHGSGWSEHERTELAGWAARHGAISLDWSSNASLVSGLKIRADGVCIDATVDGLLAHRADIESIFMAEYLEASSRG
jgi:vacuolar-type H+-ATPase subunit E/Vma4